MSVFARYLVFGIFFVVLILAGVLGYQYLVLNNNSQTPSQINNPSLLDRVANTPQNIIGDVYPRVILKNNSNNYKLLMPKDSEFTDLAKSLDILDSDKSNITRFEISAEQNKQQNGVEYRLDDNVWAKVDSSTDSGVFKISLWFDTQTVNSLGKLDWNQEVSFILLAELYNKSPIYAGVPFINRVEAIENLIKEKKDKEVNKYYFEVSF